MPSMVKILLKGEVAGCALKSHGNYIVDHGKSWKNHGIVFLNFCGNPDWSVYLCVSMHQTLTLVITFEVLDLELRYLVRRTYQIYTKIYDLIWALSRENLSLWFPTKRDLTSLLSYRD